MRETFKPRPDAKEYWPMRKGAFRAITRLHDLKGREERAPRYLAGGYDAEDNHVAITEQLLPLLKPYPADRMEEWPVEDAARNPRNDYPELLQPKERDEAKSEQQSLL